MEHRQHSGEVLGACPTRTHFDKVLFSPLKVFGRQVYTGKWFSRWPCVGYGFGSGVIEGSSWEVVDAEPCCGQENSGLHSILLEVA